MATKKTRRSAAPKAARASKAPNARVTAPRKKAAAPAVTAPVAAVRVPAPQATRNPWMLWILVTVIVLVGAEVFTMVKGKLERQGELKLIRVIGERGGPPEATGKFWGPGNIRVDRKRDRVCMIDSKRGKGTTVRVSLSLKTAACGPRDVTAPKETTGRGRTFRSAGRGPRPRRGSHA